MVKTWIITSIAYLLKGIPESVVQNLSSLAASAESALKAAKNKSIRTPLTTAQCKKSFDALTAEMQDIKKRYFLSPPLTDSDFAALGLKPRDSIHTSSRIPTAQIPTAQIMEETYLLGRHELGVKIAYVTCSPNKGSLVGYGETPTAVQRIYANHSSRCGKRPAAIRLRREQADRVFCGADREQRWEVIYLGPMVSALIRRSVKAAVDCGKRRGRQIGGFTYERKYK